MRFMMNKLLIAVMLGISVISGTVFAAGGVVKSPTGDAPDHCVYYPGTD